MSLHQDIRQQTLPAFVELFELDCTQIGGQLYRYTNGQQTSFGRHPYYTVPIKYSGIQKKTDGSLSRSSIIIDNVSKVLLSAVIGLGDLVGAKFTIIHTLEKYLDTGVSPDATQCTRTTMHVFQKKLQTASAIEFELADALEMSSGKLPNQICTTKIFPAIGRGTYR